MLRLLILSLALINSSNIPRTTAATPPGKYQNDTTFVENECKSTPFPITCYNSLSSYSSTIKSDPIKLCITSLVVNLNSAKNASSSVFSILQKAKSTSSPEVSVPNECLGVIDHTLKDLHSAMEDLLRNIQNFSFTRALNTAMKLAKLAASMSMHIGKCVTAGNVGALVDTLEKVKKAVDELLRITTNTKVLIIRNLVKLQN